MLYEILWPGQYYTLEADELETAIGTIMVLGYGEYGLRRTSNAEIVFPVLGNAAELEAWFEEHYELGSIEFIEDYAEDVGECLETICHGDAIGHRASSADGDAEARRDALVQWYKMHPEKDIRLYTMAQLILISDVLLRTVIGQAKEGNMSEEYPRILTAREFYERLRISIPDLDNLLVRKITIILEPSQIPECVIEAYVTDVNGEQKGETEIKSYRLVENTETFHGDKSDA